MSSIVLWVAYALKKSVVVLCLNTIFHTLFPYQEIFSVF